VRVDVMSRLCPYVREPAWRDAMLAEIAAAKHPTEQPKLLAEAAPHLDGPQLDAALAAALAIADGSTRASALAGLAPHLVGPALERAVDAVPGLPAGAPRME